MLMRFGSAARIEVVMVGPVKLCSIGNKMKCLVNRNFTKNEMLRGKETLVSYIGALITVLRRELMFGELW